MTLLVGTDEAGYGPNLGPLVISVTSWRVPSSDLEPDLYPILSHVVRAAAASSQHIPIADSKRLYKPGGGLANLERGVLTGLALLDQRATTWREVWRTLALCDDGQLAICPWEAAYDGPLPIDLPVDQLASDHQRLAAGLRQADVALTCLRSTAVPPAEFNQLLDKHGSKGAALSLKTLELVRDALRLAEMAEDDVNGQDQEPVVIQCDKHGGRNRYLAILQTVFPEHRIEIVREGREASVYRWVTGSRRVEIRFVAKGESFLPAALASMASKYLRELAMIAFNHFWRQHLPTLKPTAGYPLDAVRFKADIATVQQQLGIADDLLWRRK